MKLKAAIASFLVMGMLLIGGRAEAALITSTTVAGWALLPGATIPDTFDNDAAWTLTGFSAGLGLTAVTITEVEIAGVELYTVAYDFGVILGGLTPGTNVFIDYTMTITGDEHFVGVSLDSTVPGQTPEVTVTKFVTGGANNTTLTSIAGNPVGPNSISGQLVNIHETFVVGTDGFLSGATNTFTVASVPEPMSLILIGIGLIGLGLTGRRSKV